MAKVVYKATFPSDFEAMMKTLDDALDTLVRDNHIPKEKESCARLCLEEALVNAVRHGNECDVTRDVTLEIVKECGGCRVRVRDEGCGFNPEDIQLPTSDLPGGRGICLIRHFVDELSFDPKNRCLEMLFRWVA